MLERFYAFFIGSSSYALPLYQKKSIFALLNRLKDSLTKVLGSLVQLKTFMPQLTGNSTSVYKCATGLFNKNQELYQNEISGYPSVVKLMEVMLQNGCTGYGVLREHYCCTNCIVAKSLSLHQKPGFMSAQQWLSIAESLTSCTHCSIIDSQNNAICPSLSWKQSLRIFAAPLCFPFSPNSIQIGNVLWLFQPNCGSFHNASACVCETLASAHSFQAAAKLRNSALHP